MSAKCEWPRCFGDFPSTKKTKFTISEKDKMSKVRSNQLLRRICREFSFYSMWWSRFECALRPFHDLLWPLIDEWLRIKCIGALFPSAYLRMMQDLIGLNASPKSCTLHWAAQSTCTCSVNSATYSSISIHSNWEVFSSCGCMYVWITFL